MRTQADGEAIRRLREEQGLNITELARLAEVSPAHLSRMENGDRHGRLPIRQRIAEVLGTTVTAISKPVPVTPRTNDKAAA